MKDKIINWCRGVNNWFVYVASYKENKENDLISDKKLIEQNRKIDELKLEIEGYKHLENERINLIHLRENTIHELQKKYGELHRELKELTEKLNQEKAENTKLEKLLNEKEHQRRQKSSILGAKQGKINRLEKKIEELNNEHKLEILSKEATIEYLKRHRRAPDIEEIKAYEYQRKEVEKRMK